MEFRTLPLDKRTIGYSNEVYRFIPKNTGGCYFEIIKEPFGNCQIFSIAWMNFFIDGSENAEDFFQNLRYAYELVQHKKILMVDLKIGYVQLIKNLLTKGNLDLNKVINFEKSYISTNESVMCILQLKIEEILKTVKIDESSKEIKGTVV